MNFDRFGTYRRRESRHGRWGLLSSPKFNTSHRLSSQRRGAIQAAFLQQAEGTSNPVTTFFVQWTNRNDIDLTLPFTF
jgi:hypothetical protein